MMINNQQSSLMTNNHTPHHNAASAYGQVQQANISGFEVVSELYKGMIRFVGQAKESYKIGRLDDMCMYIEKTNKILIALQSHLDFEQGGEASVFLNDFYNGIFGKLFKVLRADNPEAEFDEVYEILKPVAKIWENHAENAKKGTPDTHVAMPELPNTTTEQ